MNVRRTIHLELSDDELDDLYAVLYWAAGRVEYPEGGEQPARLRLKAGVLYDSITAAD